MGPALILFLVLHAYQHTPFLNHPFLFPTYFSNECLQFEFYNSLITCLCRDPCVAPLFPFQVCSFFLSLCVLNAPCLYPLMLDHQQFLSTCLHQLSLVFVPHEHAVLHTCCGHGDRPCAVTLGLSVMGA